MWCPHCNKETASVPVRTGDGVCCAMCGEGYFKDKPSDETIREARDIIARWSSSDLLDQISTLPQIPPLSERHKADSTPKESPSTDLTPPQTNPLLPNESSENSGSSTPKKITAPNPESGIEAARQIAEKTIPDVGESATPIQSPPESPAPVVPVSRPQSPNNVVDDSEKSNLQPRKRLPRKSQSRQQRQRTTPSAKTDQGMKPMSRKLRVDNPGGDQPELPDEQPMNVAGGKIQSNSASGSRRRVDTGEPIADVLGTGNRRVRTQGRPRRRYIDEAHDAVARGPHFAVTPQRRSNLTSVTGQFLAYLGVLGLTIGTAMVIYGHFGGYSEYTPTGWLVTTVAQMMLFLGVINLVSGGMEQTNSDVSQRMEYLGAQLMRIEQVTEEALHGPKIDPRRYADPTIAVEEHEHAAVLDG